MSKKRTPNSAQKGEQADNSENVPLSGLLFAESMENYVKLHTTERRLTTLLALKNLEEVLPSPPFYRVHRSYLANLQHV